MSVAGSHNRSEEKATMHGRDLGRSSCRESGSTILFLRSTLGFEESFGSNLSNEQLAPDRRAGYALRASGAAKSRRIDRARLMVEGRVRADAEQR